MEASFNKGRCGHTTCVPTYFSLSLVVCVLFMSLDLAPAVPLAHAPADQALWEGDPYDHLPAQTVHGQEPSLLEVEDAPMSLSKEFAAGQRQVPRGMGSYPETIETNDPLLNAILSLKNSASNRVFEHEMRRLAQILRSSTPNYLAKDGRLPENVEKRGPRFSVSGDLQVTSDFLRGLHNRRQQLISASNVYQDLKSVGRK